MRILLVENPNVGKSVGSSHVTGTGAIASDYPRITLEFVSGCMKLGNEKAEIVDVPLGQPNAPSRCS